MALREIRIYLSTGDADRDKEFSVQIHQPFVHFMDSVMRGRFKEYSGDEVKGVNLVNLRLYTPNRVSEMREAIGGNLQFDEWRIMLNTLELESEISESEFLGTRFEKVQKAIAVFIRYAQGSNIPQIKTLINHIGVSNDIDQINKSIEKADREWAAFNARLI